MSAISAEVNAISDLLAKAYVLDDGRDAGPRRHWAGQFAAYIPVGSAGGGVRQLRGLRWRWPVVRLPGGRSALWSGHRYPCAVQLRSGASVRSRSGLSVVPARHRLPPCEPGLPGLSALRGVRLSKRQRRPRLGWPVGGSDGGRQRPQLQSESCSSARQASQGRDGKRSVTNACAVPGRRAGVWLRGQPCMGRWCRECCHASTIPSRGVPDAHFFRNASDAVFRSLCVNLCNVHLKQGTCPEWWSGPRSAGAGLLSPCASLNARMCIMPAHPCRWRHHSLASSPWRNLRPAPTADVRAPATRPRDPVRQCGGSSTGPRLSVNADEIFRDLKNPKMASTWNRQAATMMPGAFTRSVGRTTSTASWETDAFLKCGCCWCVGYRRFAVRSRSSSH